MVGGDSGSCGRWVRGRAVANSLKLSKAVDECVSACDEG